MITSDPWASAEYPLGSQTPQPKVTTRTDLIELATRALMGYPADHEWAPGDSEPTAPGEPSAREIFGSLAQEALDAAYPQVESAEEIEALNWQAVIVNDRGAIRERVIHPNNKLDYLGKPWSKPYDETGKRRVGYSSAELVASGPWTVVFGGQA